MTIQELSDAVKSSSDVWTAISHLTNGLGREAGNQLETLLIQSLAARERDVAEQAARIYNKPVDFAEFQRRVLEMGNEEPMAKKPEPEKFPSAEETRSIVNAEKAVLDLRDIFVEHQMFEEAAKARDFADWLKRTRKK